MLDALKRVILESGILFKKTMIFHSFQIISTNTKEVLNDSSFQDVELNTVITVFSLDHLNIDSELDLFDAAVRYSKAQDKRGAEWSFSSTADNGPTSEKRPKSPEPSTSKVRIDQKLRKTSITNCK